MYWVNFVFSKGFQIPISGPEWSLLTLLSFIIRIFKIFWGSSQWALVPRRPTQMTLIYLINWILYRFLILLSSVALYNLSFVFFSLFSSTYMWTGFSLIILAVLCIRSTMFLPSVFRSQPQILGDLYQRLYFSQCFKLARGNPNEP